MRAILVLVVAALSLYLAPPAVAANEGPLTDQKIEATIETMQDLRPVMEKHQEALDNLISEDERANMDPCSPPAKVRESAAYREMETVVREHGFKDGEQWCRMAQRITAAYAAVKIEAEEPQWREKMAEVREQIESAPNLSPEQKAQLMAQLEESSRVLGAQDAPEADKAAVRANMGKIEAALEDLAVSE
ncbi:MAG TPA: hypothetical protein PKY73_08015 [Hyphomonas sp.]|nr:hypothetical protein [Hyphomonas sp.]